MKKFFQGLFVGAALIVALIVYLLPRIEARGFKIGCEEGAVQMYLIKSKTDNTTHDRLLYVIDSYCAKRAEYASEYH